MTRNYTLDKLRIYCAFIVFLNHLLYIKSNLSSENYVWIKICEVSELAPFAVSIFFGISGFSLRIQTALYGGSKKWIQARIARLLPVYWVAIFLPAIFYLSLKIVMNYNISSFLLTLVGMNTFFDQYATPHFNGPLWSLSVEILLSLSVLILYRVKKELKFLLISCLFLLAIYNREQIFLQAMPFFTLGYFFPNLKTFHTKARFIPLIITIIPCYLYPDKVLNFPTYNVRYLAQLLLVFLLLLFCQINKGAPSLLYRYSSRAYCLYAFHFPIIFTLDRSLFRSQDKLSIEQILLTIFCVFIITEFFYRFVDLKAIKFSRILLKTN